MNIDQNSDYSYTSPEPFEETHTLQEIKKAADAAALWWTQRMNESLRKKYATVFQPELAKKIFHALIGTYYWGSAGDLHDGHSIPVQSVSTETELGVRGILLATLRETVSANLTDRPLSSGGIFPAGIQLVVYRERLEQYSYRDSRLTGETIIQIK